MYTGLHGIDDPAVPDPQLRFDFDAADGGGAVDPEVEPVAADLGTFGAALDRHLHFGEFVGQADCIMRHLIEDGTDGIVGILAHLEIPLDAGG